MENQTQFDLNQSMRQWRASLAQSGTVTKEQAEELEQHLLDSMAQLGTEQLSEEERFLVARSRLGSGEAVAHEFSKVNPARVWMSRLCWMLCGLYLFRVSSAVPNSISLILSRCAPGAVSGHWLGLISVLLQWGAMLVPVGAFFYVTRSSPGVVSRAVEACIRRPALTAVGLVSFAAIVFALPNIPWLVPALRNHLGESVEVARRFSTIMLWRLFGFNLIEQILVPIGIVYLGRRALEERFHAGQLR